jgi:hypothetical protein
MAKKTKNTEAQAAPEFDYKTIKTFEDACQKEGINPEQLPEVTNIPEEFAKPVIAAYKLMVVFKAINNGWRPDWGNWKQNKYYPWLSVLSSGFGFSGTFYSFGSTVTAVGSRLCTDTSEKALYIAEQFKEEYKEYFLYSE